MSGKPGRSGRKPAPKTLIDRMLARSEPSLPDIWQGLIDLAMGVRIGKLNENGEIVNVYAKPPDKEAIAEIMNRHFGRPKIEIDQRTKHEVELDPSLLLAAVREAEARGAAFLSMPERQLTGPTRELSYDPVLQLDITGHSERDVADYMIFRHSSEAGALESQTALVGIPTTEPEDQADCLSETPADCSMDSMP